jgi:branched-chain amino acid transport system substrate-binding protein
MYKEIFSGESEGLEDCGLIGFDWSEGSDFLQLHYRKFMVTCVKRASFILFFLLTASFVYAAEPVRIGLTLGLTGKYSQMSDQQVKGFKLWERDVNRAGGILGRPVEVIVYDDGSSPQRARELYTRLIVRDRVDLLFAPYSSEITEAILPLAEKYGYPLLASGANADRLWQSGGKYLFGMWQPASKNAVGFLELLVLNNFKRVAIAHAEDSFSTDAAAGAKRWAERFGLKVVFFEGFGKETSSLNELVKMIKAGGPQALIVCGHLADAVGVRRSLKALKWYPRAYYGSGAALQAFYEELGPDADYTFSNSLWEHEGGPGCCEFYESFKDTYKEAPSYHAATAYAAGQIMEEAIKRAGVLNRDRIRDVLSSTDMLTIMGRYGVDKTGMQTKQFNLVIQWQMGKKEIVWPEQAKTGKAIFR